MRPRLQAAASLALAALVAALAAAALDRGSPWPLADTLRGSEEAFLDGAYERELTREGPRRRVSPAARLRFRRLPPGPLRLELAYRNAPTPVDVVVNGALLGTWRAGTRSGAFDLKASAGALDVELRGEGREIGGRRLGPLFQSARVVHARPRAPSPGLLGLFTLPALAACAAGLLAGLTARLACTVALGTTLLQAATLAPYGLVRSPYATTLAIVLTLGTAASLAGARLLGRRARACAPWAFVALLAAWALFGVAAVSPLMEVSDAVFHANKLEDVAAGDLLPVSVTQHERPFRFPYGVSFYALLAPAARAGCDRVLLVRWGAALAAWGAAWALFGLLRDQPARAAAAVLALLLLPATFEVFSYGNLSNVFGQALTVAFFAWWAGRAPGGWSLGALLLGAGCLAHFSSLVVLAALATALAIGHARARRPLSAEAPARDPRGPALGLGLALAGAYYACFAGLMFEQLPRLLEGAGSDGRASLPAALMSQGSWALARWGWPALALAACGWPRRSVGRLDVGLRAFWAAGGALLLLALASPLEVRYLYALTPPLAIAAADGALRLWRGGRPARAGVLLLAAVQGGLALRELLEALLVRYRP